MKRVSIPAGTSETMARSERASSRTTGITAMNVVIFFVSVAIISACLFVFVESYPRTKPSPQYEKAAAEMRESLHNAVTRIGQTERPHELKLDVIKGEYRAVKR